MIFQEFTPQMLDFLAENHIRNSKVWYEEHKADCRRLAIEPFYHLTEHLAPTMLEMLGLPKPVGMDGKSLLAK